MTSGLTFSKALNRWQIRCRDGSKTYYYRAVVEAHLGRHLRSEEKVHHINGDSADDRFENLTVIAHGDHMRLHLKGVPNRHISDEEIDRRVDLYRSGLTLHQVADRCGVSHESVRNTLIRAAEIRRPQGTKAA